MISLKTDIALRLAEQYADMLSLDFRRRATLLDSWHHSANDLQQWDKRLLAYIEGLKLLRQEAVSYFDGWTESLLSRGDIFALGTFAFHTGNARLLGSCLGLTQSMPHLISVAESVIEWAPATSALWETVYASATIRVMAGWLRDDLPAAPALTDDEISLLQRIPAAIPGLLYALRKQYHPGYLQLATELSASEDPHISLGALTAILTRHLPYNGMHPHIRLVELTVNNNEQVRNQAVMLYLLNTNYPPADFLGQLQKNKSDRRLYLTALGYSGLPANVEELIRYLDDPAYARLAAASIVMITGASPESTGWLQTAPPTPSSVDVIPVSESDDGLSWPDRSAFEIWWKSHSGKFDGAEVYVAGRSATSVIELQAVLQQGCLALHPLARARLIHLNRGNVCALSASGFSSIQQYTR